MDNQEDISFRVCRTVEIAFNPTMIDTNSELADQSRSSPTLQLPDCQYIWEEVRCADKIPKLGQCFEESSQMLLSQLQNDQVSENGKLTLLNFLCQIGILSVKMGPYASETAVHSQTIGRTFPDLQSSRTVNVSQPTARPYSVSADLRETSTDDSTERRDVAQVRLDPEENSICKDTRSFPQVKAEPDSDSENVFHVVEDSSIELNDVSNHYGPSLLSNAHMVNTTFPETFSEQRRKHGRKLIDRKISNTTLVNDKCNVNNVNCDVSTQEDAIKSLPGKNSAEGLDEQEFICNNQNVGQSSVFSANSQETSNESTSMVHPIDVMENSSVMLQHSMAENAEEDTDGRPYMLNADMMEVSPPTRNNANMFHGDPLSFKMPEHLDSTHREMGNSALAGTDVSWRPDSERTYRNSNSYHMGAEAFVRGDLITSCAADQSYGAPSSKDDGDNIQGPTEVCKAAVIEDSSMETDSDVLAVSTEENHVSGQIQSVSVGDKKITTHTNPSTHVPLRKYTFKNARKRAVRHDGLPRPYKCTECNRCFAHQSTLYTHVQMHREKKVLVCKICGARTIHKSSFDRHMTRHMGDRFKCDACQRCFHSKSALISHRCTHARKRRLKHMRRHSIRNNSQKHNAQYPGSQPSMFSDSSGKHGGSSQADARGRFSQKPENENMSELELSQVIVPSSVPQEGVLYVQPITDKSVQIMQGKGDTAEESIQSKVGQEKSLTPSNTTTVYVNRDSVATLPSTLSYQSPVARESAQVLPLNVAGEAEQPSEFSTANELFTQPSVTNEMVHATQHHTLNVEQSNSAVSGYANTLEGSTRNLVCTICDKSFGHEKTLWTHMKEHYARKLYVCELCGIKTQWKCSYYRHMKRHGRFCCQLCGASFASHKKLLNHCCKSK
ncbi:zinc finger protein 629-like [Ptychodera flava]|uniref:zinc finger protein 629-like n=1 Tax=Ptychodera flava TaxID=63121 RepID=UPI00396AAAC2